MFATRKYRASIYSAASMCFPVNAPNPSSAVLMAAQRPSGCSIATEPPTTQKAPHFQRQELLRGQAGTNGNVPS